MSGTCTSSKASIRSRSLIFRKPFKFEPYFSTYSNLGTSYFFLKQYSNAVEMFEKAVALNPNDTMMMVNLADAYRGAGQQDKARTTYQQAIAVGFKELQTNPQNADVMARDGALLCQDR